MESNIKMPNPWGMLFIFWVLVFMFVMTQCHAQKQVHHYDTVYCHVEAIKKVIEQPSSSGKSTRLFVVYNTPDIHELIPISRSTYDYMRLCEANGVKPSLGIKIKDGQIATIIKYRRKYYVKK